ncbi:MAG: glycosyltransferase family 4 protein [Actinomycetota bacterium]
MRVAFDVGLPLQQPTGVTRYTVELGPRLRDLGVVLKPYRIALRAPRTGDAMHWRLPARAVHLAWWLMDKPPIEALVGDVDLVHGTNFVLPATRVAPGVVTIHDLSFVRPDGFAPDRRVARMVEWSVRRARAVICPSVSVSEEIAAAYGVSESRLFVTPEGIGPEFRAPAPLNDLALANLGIRRPFAMALGTLQPRKNLHALVAAWDAARDDLDGWQLALVGPPGWGSKLPPAPGVVCTGWIDHTLLPGLLAAAEVFCFPSLYEGFGLPPLEAMAAETPVLAGDYPVASEILGDAALIVDRRSVESIAEGLRALALDGSLREQLVARGRTRSASFTWEQTAARTLDAYHSAMSASGR